MIDLQEKPLECTEKGKDMKNFIKDVFKVHSLVAVFCLGGREMISPSNIANRYNWTEAHALDTIKVFRAIEPTALSPHFRVECPSCEAQTSLDSHLKVLSKEDTVVTCATCAKNINVIVNNIQIYFKIDRGYARNREAFL